MNTREEFGSYVLLKKLYEDPLGETLRAGKLGAQGLEQVVLLRVFNGSGIDRDRLWQKISNRRAVQEALKSPNIATGVDLGRVRDIPYVAYDYISGKNLASLLQQAVRGRSPIPLDHALLIAERIALGLAVGYESRHEDQRIYHGFLTPHLVMLSNEGEIQVLGFEAAPGLREGALAGAVPPEIARYLSPEALGGHPVSKGDDVYSLGALLFELLTGRPLPSGATPDHVAGAVLASEGTPLPPELAGLIQKSLAPGGERIADVVTWHKSLSKLMIDGQYNPTTFNLAFFMHNLFRDDIELESKEIEVEKTLAIPGGVGAATTAIPADQLQAGPASEGMDETGAVAARYGLDEPKSSKTGLWIGLAAVLAIAVGAVLYFTVFSKTPPPVDPSATASPPPIEVPETAEPAGQEGLTGEGEDPAAAAEDLEAQLDRLIAERAAQMEQSLRSEYDKRIQEMQKTLEETQQAASERERQAAAAAEEARRQQEEEARTAQQAPSTAGQQGGGEDKVATTPPGATSPPTEGAPSAGGAGTQPGGGGQPAAGTQSPAKQPAQQPSATRPEPEPQQRVRVGDLVESGPGVVPPKYKSMPDPRYPPLAQRLNKRATVPVRVLVNENGRVDRAELVDQDPGFGFGDAALAAARAARFDPATKNNVRVKMWYVLKIDFKQ